MDSKKELLYLIAGGVVGAMLAYIGIKGKYEFEKLEKEVSNLIKDYKTSMQKIANALEKLDKLYKE